jgi:hypothetical protein
VEGCSVLDLLGPLCHFAVFCVVGMDSINDTRKVVCAAETAQEREQLVNFFFISILFGDLRVCRCFLLSQQNFQLVLKSCYFRVRELLESSHLLFKAFQVQFSLELEFSHLLRLFVLNLLRRAQLDEWNEGFFLEDFYLFDEFDDLLLVFVP